MAAKQGFNRLMNGTEKRITPSEAEKGYFFVTNDKLAIETLGDSFDVLFDESRLKDRHIDSYGRISIVRSFLRDYKDATVYMKIKGKTLIIKSI